jgi:outer membrane protein OmpA-like peptidoglycan-associated protein
MAGLGSVIAAKRMRGAAEVRVAGFRSVTAAALLAAVLGLSGCGTWADPTDWFEDDEPAPVTTPTGSAAPESVTSDRFPNLGRVPPRPVEVSSEGERRRAMDSLAADRDNARHTDQELRARPADSNTPPPAPRAPVTQLPAASSAQPALPAQQAEAPVTLQPPAPTLPAPTLPAPTQPVPTQPVPTQPVPTQPVQAQNQVPRGAGVVDTFSQSLAQSAATTLPPNLAQSAPQMGGAAVPGNGGLAPSGSTLLAVVRFANADTSLGSDDRALLRRVAEYYKGTAGGRGVLAVVGYASSRTGNMDASAHRQLNYSLSQKRAEAVAAELRRRGIAADQVRVEARADAAPVYYEAMPRAEDYNRRVEIYLVN